AAVLARIATACQRSGRDPSAVALVAVSKTVPATRLRAAVAAGLTTLGENRVQELAGKAALLDGVDWHLIGHLQANKARLAVGLCSAIESVDSLDLARRLSRLSLEVRAAGAGPLPIYLQVNVDADPAKSGFVPTVLERDLAALCDLPGLRVAGLMTVGRLVAGAEEARPTFVALRDLSQRLGAREPRLGPGLSMGMSADFEVAVEEGATLVRVGQAIFGPR
ncbi:MAG TPA: YggS family pyridoxal phosphate-dependent enzyme, partial [Candidatus Limnocylindrales bacterium]|nr:YggS family pyridoxal phosphate-dependent enzyme [Candidatus Limnocylindrales bacterium]